MNRNSYYNIWIITLFFLFLSCFPFQLFFNLNIAILLLVQLVIQGLYCCFLLYILRKEQPQDIPGRIKKKNYYIFLPLLMVIASNFIYLAFFPNVSDIRLDLYTLLRLVLTVFTVINEEIIFRGYLFRVFYFKKPLTRIILVSLIFAAFHLGGFFSSFNPLDLIPVVYTFGLGLVLGLLKEYSGSIIPSLIVHLLYNLINQVLFESLIINVNLLWFYLINIFVSLIVAIYLILLYIFKIKKDIYFLF